MENEPEVFNSEMWTMVKQSMPEFDIEHLKRLVDQMYEELNTHGKVLTLDDTRRKLLGLMSMIGIAVMHEANKEAQARART